MIILFLAGRILLGGYFIWNGFNHFKNKKGFVGYAASKGVPMADAAVMLTGAMMLVGGISVVLGRFSVIGMGILVLFLIPTTIVMHRFWKVTDPMARMSEEINFFKNLALTGALLMLMALGMILF